MNPILALIVTVVVITGILMAIFAVLFLMLLLSIITARGMDILLFPLSQDELDEEVNKRKVLGRLLHDLYYVAFWWIEGPQYIIHLLKRKDS